MRTTEQARANFVAYLKRNPEELRLYERESNLDFSLGKDVESYDEALGIIAEAKRKQ